MAKAAHASMKEAGKKNLSLVDAVFAGLMDSALVEAKWQNRENGERCTGTGPSGVDMAIQNEIRQMGRAEIYAHMFYECSSSSDNENNNGVCDPKRSHRPDKPAKLLPKITVKKKRSLDSQAFKNALEKSKQKSIYTKIIKIVKRLDSVEISLEQYKKKFEVNIDSEVFCTCSPSKRTDRKICPHIIWIYLNLFHLDESDPTLAQISFSSLEISNLISLCPDEIPENLDLDLDLELQRK